jgi:UDP-GlcNAc:undecaprenyl-phosphate/decaprenyl-phosphate GlcNAc-1-phosphate transferase
VDFGSYAAVGGVAAGTTLVTTPVVRRIAVRAGWVVQPDERRIHTRPTATVGGIAMFLGFVAAMAVAWRMHQFDTLFTTSEPLGVVAGAAVIFFVGLADDLRDWSAPAKMTGIVLAGIVLALTGVTMYYFRLPRLDPISVGRDLQPLATVLWLVAIANAINFIDGLDGLAAGIVAIASGTFFLYGQELDRKGILIAPNIGPLIAVVTLGICIGFLPHNFHPARIFMGDGGALLLGLLMASSTSVVGGRADPTVEASGQTYFFLAPLVLPIVILGVPIVDTLFAIVRRATHRQGIATRDMGHLHHRLVRLGHGQRRSVLILWLWTAILSGFVLYPTYTGEGNAIVPLGVAALALALFTVLHPQLRRAARDDASASANGAGVGPAAPAVVTAGAAAGRSRGAGGRRRSGGRTPRA